MSQQNPRFRSPDEETIRVVTDTSHVALVGPEWRELPPIYHAAALKAGCECDRRVVRVQKESSQASADSAKRGDPEVLIERALKTMLEREQDGDFNDSNGEPSVDAVKKLAGINVKRAQISPVWRKLKAEAGADAVDNDNDGDGDADDNE